VKSINLAGVALIRLTRHLSNFSFDFLRIPAMDIGGGSPAPGRRSALWPANLIGEDAIRLTYVPA